MPIRSDKAQYVRVLLPLTHYDACKRYAKADRRSMSNWLAVIVCDALETKMRGEMKQQIKKDTIWQK
jgi:hypothetical protein